MSSHSLSVSIVLITLAFAARCSAADAHLLRVCADPNNLPFSNQRGEGLENKLAEILSHDLSVDLKYVWFSERKNFVRNSLNAGLCDAVLGVPVDLDDALVTRPYYRSTYVLVTRADRSLKIESLYDPRLKDLRIGLHVVEDDYAPPGHLLAAQGLSANIVGYSLFGAYDAPNPPARLVQRSRQGRSRCRDCMGSLRRILRKEGFDASFHRTGFPDPIPDDPIYLLDWCRSAQGE